MVHLRTEWLEGLIRAIKTILFFEKEEFSEELSLKI